jgi:ComF family protein
LPFGAFVGQAGMGNAADAAGSLCGACRRERPAFAYARAAARYGSHARDALHAFKFDGRRSLAAPLGDLLAELGSTLPLPAVDVIVPVPLHPRRERERGFNQSWLLSRRVAAAWQVAARADVLTRTVATAPQTALGAAARRLNVGGAFRVRRPELVAGRHVLLVDDIMTTGATVGACAGALREAGAATVGVVTVARAG